VVELGERPTIHPGSEQKNMNTDINNTGADKVEIAKGPSRTGQ
jgi:hypothetical protein